MSATLVDPGASNGSVDAIKERRRCVCIIENYILTRSKREMWVDDILREILKRIESGSEADS